MLGKDYFFKIYNNYPYNGFIKFIYRFFSHETAQEDKWFKKTLVVIFIIAYIIGGISIMSGWETNIVAYVVILYTFLLLMLLLSRFIASIMRKWNTNKIRKTLGVSVREYDRCVNRYLKRN